MRNTVVRLTSLTLKNIKNVKNGTIIMPRADEKKFEGCKAEILGIYGQNGSGKTAIVDALYFLQNIMTGEKLEQSILDYIDTDGSRLISLCCGIIFLFQKQIMLVLLKENI